MPRRRPLFARDFLGNRAFEGSWSGHRRNKPAHNEDLRRAIHSRGSGGVQHESSRRSRGRCPAHRCHGVRRHGSPRALPGAHRSTGLRARPRRQRSRGRDQVERTLACLFGFGHPYAGRVTPVRGDVTRARLGLRRGRGALAERVNEIVHSAASVSFDLELDAARAINVEGTRRVLELAERCHRRGSGLRRFSYVSTAYVAGRHSGSFSEDDLDRGQRFRNTYEQSKFEAERTVTQRREQLPITVLRPSIVVGARDSGWTASFNVLYWPLRAFARGAYAALPARGDAPVDVVPVDYVADATFALSQAPEAEGATFHLTAGEQATSVGELVELASAFFERSPPAPDRSAAVSAGAASAAPTRRPRRAPPTLAATQRDVLPVLRHGRHLRRPPRARGAARERDRRRRRFAPTSIAWSQFALAADWGRRELPRARAPQAPITPGRRGGRRPRATRRRLELVGMSGERMSALDASFLAVETPSAHMHVGWVAEFSAPAESRLPTLRGGAPPHRAPRRARAALSAEARPGPVRRAHARVDRRCQAFAIDRHVYRAPGPLARPGRPGDVDAVAPRPSAVGDVGLRNTRGADVCDRRQGPPLHGRRHRRGRARLAAVGPDA